MTPKQQLIQRLYDDKHISFEEMILLMEEKPTEQRLPIYPIPFQIYPLNPIWEIPFEKPIYTVNN